MTILFHFFAKLSVDTSETDVSHIYYQNLFKNNELLGLREINAKMSTDPFILNKCFRHLSWSHYGRTAKVSDGYWVDSGSCVVTIKGVYYLCVLKDLWIHGVCCFRIAIIHLCFIILFLLIYYHLLIQSFISISHLSRPNFSFDYLH